MSERENWLRKRLCYLLGILEEPGPPILPTDRVEDLLERAIKQASKQRRRLDSIKGVIKEGAEKVQWK